MAFVYLPSFLYGKLDRGPKMRGSSVQDPSSGVTIAGPDSAHLPGTSESPLIAHYADADLSSATRVEPLNFREKPVLSLTLLPPSLPSPQAP